MKDQNIDIDLNAVKNGALNEFSMLRVLGTQIELMIKMMFGPRGLSALSGTVRGTNSQINSFARALAGESSHMLAFMKHGLDDPRTMRSRHKLERAVSGFERETGLKWPIK